MYSHCHSPNHCLILQWQRSSRILQKACNPHIHKQRQLSVFGKLPLFVLRRCSYLSGQFFDFIECKLRVLAISSCENRLSASRRSAASSEHSCAASALISSNILLIILIHGQAGFFVSSALTSSTESSTISAISS